jgi:hypothetical protein
MSGRRVGYLVADTAEAVITFAANATNSALYSKILLTFAVLLAVAAVPMLCRIDIPSAAANSILKCYDNTGNYEPCAARAGAPLSRFVGQTVGANQPAGLATIALNQPENLVTTEFNQQQNLTTTTLNPQQSPITAAVEPADWKTIAPAARRNSTIRERRASTICERRLIRCFFSALRKKVTHFASAAAVEAGSLPTRKLRD